MIKEAIIQAFRKSEYTYDESEFLVDTVIEFRKATEMLLDHYYEGKSDMVHLAGG